MIESVEQFSKLISTTTDYTNYAIPEATKAQTLSKLRSSKRIFVTGTGTSLPSALLFENLLSSDEFANTKFLPTAKMIRQISHLKTDDTVVLISHGMNRADALIIYENTKKLASTIVISGNSDYKYSDNTLEIIVPPRKEKIFCRPISPITTFIAICQIFDIDLEEYKPDTQRAKLLADWIDSKKQTILVYTADTEIAATLWGIVLREGAGLNVLTKDIENYSHGYYGVDTAKLNHRQFIILTSDSKEDQRDFNRAKNLYSLPGLEKMVYKADNYTDYYNTNFKFICEVPLVVKDVIMRTEYDMNNPIGKDENREYHEFSNHKNYI